MNPRMLVRADHGDGHVADDAVAETVRRLLAKAFGEAFTWSVDLVETLPIHGVMAVSIDQACEVMHDAYERAAVGAGWDTNPASRKPWADVPEANKVTMRAAVSALLTWLDAGMRAARGDS